MKPWWRKVREVMAFKSNPAMYLQVVRLQREREALRVEVEELNAEVLRLAGGRVESPRMTESHEQRGRRAGGKSA